MSPADIRRAFERCARALSLRPAFGRAKRVSRTRIREGLRCEIEEGPWKLVADMPTRVGGAAAGPTPAVLGRAAMGSCLAVGYMMQAAKLGVPITALEVEIPADDDDRALFGVSRSAPGSPDVRYVVTVESPAGASEVRRVLDEGDARGPCLDVFRRALACRRSERIISTGPASA